MIIIPIGTDAPIYYWPFATLGMIIFNTIIFLYVWFLPEAKQELVVDWFTLQYGYLLPWQWITSNYMHAGFMHLIGNMAVLWGIGIIVEGKIGWWRYLILYNLIGILGCAVEQTLFIFAQEGFSLGASGIIFGLLAMALVWAPANEFTVLVVIWFGFYMRVFTFECTVYAYGLFCLFVELVMFIVHMAVMANSLEEHGMIVFMCSELLHLMGAIVGFGIGVAMLKKGWVDCENWDLFSWWKDRHVMTKEQLAEEKLKTPEGQKKLAEARETMHTQFLSFLKADEPAAALSVHRRGKIQFADWQLPEPEHVHLIQSLRKAQMWDETVLSMVEYLHLFTERAPLVRLALGQLLIEQLARPKQGMKVLDKLDPKQLPPQQQQKLAALRKRAQADVEENPFEAVVDDW